MINNINFICPCCNHNLTVDIKDSQVISIIDGSNFEVSQEEISEVMIKNGIEFG